jgi:hypothetical protein
LTFLHPVAHAAESALYSRPSESGLRQHGIGSPPIFQALS